MVTYEEEFYSMATNRKYKQALALTDTMLENMPAEKIITDVISKTLQKLQSFDEDPSASGFPSLTLLSIAKICDEALQKVIPHLSSAVESKGTVVLGTPEAEYHSIGKLILSAFLRASGWTVIDIGLNNLPEKFITTAKEHNANYILVSTFLLPSAFKIADISSALHKSTIKDQVKLIAGGPPFNFHLGLAKKLGCDATAVDALDTIRLLNSLSGYDTESAEKIKLTKRFKKMSKRIFGIIKRGN